MKSFVAFNSETLAVLAAMAARLDARMEDAIVAEPDAAGVNPDSVKATSAADFIEKYAAKLEAEDKKAAEKEKAAEDKRAAAAAAGGGEDDDDVDEIDEEEIDEDHDRGEGDGDEEEEEIDDDDPDEDERDEDDKPVVDKDKKGKQSALTKLAKRLHLDPQELEALPDDVKPILTKRLKDMDGHFTRTMQKATEFRAREREFSAEERYRSENKAEWLAEQLLGDEDLEQLVADRLEKLRSDPTAQEAAKVVAKDKRSEAAKAIDKSERQEREDAEWREARGEEVGTIAKTACSKFGIPFDRGVEAAIAFEVTQSEQGDISDKRIKEIVKELAVERERSRIATRREERKRHIQGKTDTERSAPKLRPGQGRAGGSTRPTSKPLTLEENMKASAKKLFPGEKD